MSCSAFSRDEVADGGSLVVPVRVLWRRYLAYCALWGFEPQTAGQFVRYMVQRGATVRTRSGRRGRLRRYFEGIGHSGPTAGREDAA